MSGITLTEDVIVNLTGKKNSHFSQLQDLDLSDSKIKRVEPSAFKRFMNLKSLNLSNNLIKSLSFEPQVLCQLSHLDVSENSLGSLEFLEQLPNLEEIVFECNGLEAWQSYAAVFLCPKLKKINNKPTTKLLPMVQMFQESCWNLIDSTWNESSFSGLTAETDHTKIAEDLLQKVRAKRVSLAGVTLQLKEFLLRKLCQLFVKKSAEMKDSKSNKSEDEEVKDEEDVEESHKDIEDGDSSADGESVCEPIEDYDPIHFIRCHFCDKKALKNGHHDDDPTDEITNVWWCKMEPDTQNSAETTGILATCGGDSVCLIDCSTGLVIKRYRQLKEQFYSLDWTTLTLESEGAKRKTNILAVGGQNGHLKLLHPAQLVCFAEHGTGRPNKAVDDFYYSNVMFHPKQRTWLFCGSSDSTITLFDIGVPSGISYSTEIRQLIILVTKPSAPVVNMVFHESTSHLVAGTQLGCYAWEIDENKIKTKGSTKRLDPSFEIKLPSEKKFVDGLVLLDASYVACKCVADACIYVFSLTKALKHKDISLSLLPWCQTSTEFISLGACNGIIGCGDDEGNIWLYKLQPWLRSHSKDESTVFHPSRILSWPECLLGPRQEDQRMTDVLDKPEPLVINAVAITSDSNYVVGVTDCNLVCIWKKVTEDSSAK